MTCPGCGVDFEPVPSSRRYCRPSCRARHEQQQRRLPNTTPMMTFDSELPTEAEMAEARRRREGQSEVLSVGGADRDGEARQGKRPRRDARTTSFSDVFNGFSKGVASQWHEEERELAPGGHGSR